MRLVDALAVRPGDVVAFVGAGGKTSAMFRLAAELAAQGLRVLTTTTTRIGQDELAFAPTHVALGERLRIPRSLANLLAAHRHVFVYTRLEENRKVRGVTPAWLDEHMTRQPFLDVLLVEADGSRRLPLKAPLPHEPAIPASVRIVVPVVGLDVLGQPLDNEHIYGAEQIHNLIGHPLGAPITPEAVAAVLLHPRIAFKNVPPAARVMPLLNKVTPETLPQAREIARRVLTDLHVERVLIGAVQDEDPVREVRRRVGAVILAAGESKRMGKPKLLLPWGKRSTVIREVCQRVVACSGLYEVVVVTGRLQAEIRRQIADLPVRVVYNPAYALGEMLSSLKVGVGVIWQTSDAALVVLGDQPFLQREVVHDLLQAYAEGRGRIIAPTYEGQRGHPLIIDRAFWQAILELPPGAAPRDLLRKHEDEVYTLPVNTDSVLRDIDTPEDYRRAREQGG